MSQRHISAICHKSIYELQLSWIYSYRRVPFFQLFLHIFRQFSNKSIYHISLVQSYHSKTPACSTKVLGKGVNENSVVRAYSIYGFKIICEGCINIIRNYYQILSLLYYLFYFLQCPIVEFHRCGIARID